MSGRPIFIAFRKKMRPKVFATTQDMPAYFNVRGRCSLDNPHPKLLFAMITSPFCAFLEKSGATSKIDAHDISISFKRNATIKSKDVLKIRQVKPLLDSIYF